MNSLPKPLVIGGVIVILAIAAFIIFKTTAGKGENEGYGSPEEIQKRQQQSSQNSNASRPQDRSQKGYGNMGSKSQ